MEVDFFGNKDSGERTSEDTGLKNSVLDSITDQLTHLTLKTLFPAHVIIKKEGSIVLSEIPTTLCFGKICEHF